MSTTNTGTVLPPLTNYGCPAIAEIEYLLCFVGSVWKTPHLEAQANHLLTGLTTTLNDRHANGVFSQYLGGKTAGARLIGGRTTVRNMVFDMEWSSRLDRADLQRVAKQVLDTWSEWHAVSWVWSDEAARKPHPAIVLVLPPGTIMDDAKVADGPTSSMEGRASIHGTFLWPDAPPEPISQSQAVYFCAAVWSDGCNGASMPSHLTHKAWEPWQNTCAALYNELAEFRTNQNVDALSWPNWQSRNLVGWVAFYDDTWQEIGDLTLEWANPLPEKTYGLLGSHHAPMTLLWSNTTKSPHTPPPPPGHQPPPLPGPYFPEDYTPHMSPYFAFKRP